MKGRDLLSGALSSLATTLGAAQYAATIAADSLSSTASTLSSLAGGVQLYVQPAKDDSTASSTSTTDAKKTKKKGRTTTSCKKNVTVSLTLECEDRKKDEHKNKCEHIKTFEQPNFYTQALSVAKTGSIQSKIIKDGLCIPDELAILETNIKAETTKLRGLVKKIKQGNTLSPKETADKKECEDIIERLQLRKVNHTKDQIIEHAARRADLFFYLLIAVYKKGVTINKGGTDKQHGTGSDERGTAACHSSIFPSVDLQNIPQSRLTLLFYNSTSTDNASMLNGTYFAEALNATVELPKIVNDFDGHLEGRFQQTSFLRDCEALLNDCATGKIDPITGMDKFYDYMNQFFICFDRKHLDTGKRTIPNYLAHKKIWEYQRKGTFYGAYTDTLRIRSTYARAMLKSFGTSHHVTPYEMLYARIQRELLESKADAKPAMKP